MSGRQTVARHPWLVAALALASPLAAEVRDRGEASAPAAVGQEDAAILRAVLSRVARSGEAQCVGDRLGPAPFSRMRAVMAEGAAMEGRLPQDASQLAAGLRQDLRNWYVPTGGWGERVLVAPPVRDRLSTAAAAIVERGAPTLPPGEPVGVPVDRAWLAPGQRLGSRAMGCVSIDISEVSREGNVVFVDVGWVYGPLAGHGETWALARSGSEWRLIAIRPTWVS